MPSRRRLTRIVVAALAAALALTACTGQDKGTAATPGAPLRFAQGERFAAPALAGDLVGGGSYATGQHAGKVLVLNFWSSYCAPCRLEADELESVYQANSADGITFLGVNTRDDRDAAKVFIGGRNSYPSLFDPAGRLSLGFADVPPITVPSTLIIDRTGKIAAVIRRATSRDELGPLVREIAAEKAS